MQIRRSLWITFAWSNASIIAMFAFSLVLARILTPKEIGVFSLCMVVINISSVFRDLGTNPFLIRKSEVTAADLGSVLGLTITTSWTLALGLWLSRHAIADYFGEPLMAQVLPVLLIGFLIIPLAGVMTSMLVRNLSAGRSALVSLFATIAYGTVLIGLALAGYGALAPAWANTANLLSSLVCLWFVMPKGFRLWPRWSGWGPSIRFSGGVVLTSLANTAHASVPDLVIGRSLGAHDVGLFSRANGTVGLFQQVVGPTLNYNALPIIAKTFHEGTSALVAMLSRSNEMLTVIAWPVYAWIAIFPGAIIGLLYGPTWIPAAELVPWLCLAAAARTPFMIIGPALQAVNRPFTAGMVSVISLASRVGVLAIFGVHDLHRFVIVLCVADLLALSAWIYASKKHLGLGLRAAIFSQQRSVAVTAACVVALLLVQAALPREGASPLVVVLTSGGALTLAWLLSVRLSAHPFGDELAKVVNKVRGVTA